MRSKGSSDDISAEHSSIKARSVCEEDYNSLLASFSQYVFVLPLLTVDTP